MLIGISVWGVVFVGDIYRSEASAAYIKLTNRSSCFVSSMIGFCQVLAASVCGLFVVGGRRGLGAAGTNRFRGRFFVYGSYMM